MSQAAANTVRRLLDANLYKTKALPAANADNATATIDFGQTILGPLADEIEVLVEIEGTPSLVDTKLITLTLKDSADNNTFAAIPGVATLVQTGAGGVGAAANSRRYKLPPGTRRYFQVASNVENGGGNNTAKSYSVKVLVNP